MRMFTKFKPFFKDLKKGELGLAENPAPVGYQVLGHD